MFIISGKILMSLVWLMIISSPFTKLEPVAPLMLAGGGIVLLLHGAQVLLMKSVMSQSGHWRKGDGIQLLLFGVFALMGMKKRLTEQSR